MENNKKSKLGLIIIIIIILLLIAFGAWFFLLRDKETSNNESTNTNKTSEQNQASKEEIEEKIESKYEYKDGVLTQIVDEEGKPKQTDFVIDGLILLGNRHDYEETKDNTEETIAILAKEGYKKEGINSSFYLNEYITFYIDTKYKGNEEDVRILVVPHKIIEEHEKMDASTLELIASEKGFITNFVKPDETNYKYVNEGYVSQDYPEGKYDILFMYKGELAYYMTINEEKEPNN